MGVSAAFLKVFNGGTMSVFSTHFAAGWYAASACLLMLGLAWPIEAQAQVRGSDHPLVGRFEGSSLLGYDQKPFQSSAFVFKGTPDRSLLPGDVKLLEGKATSIAYSGPQVTSLEIFRNYQASLKSRGFMEAFVCENNTGQAKACPEPKQIAYKVVPLGASVVEHRGRQCFKNSRYGLFHKGEEATVALLVSDCFNDKDPPLTLISVVEHATMKTDQIVVPTAADIAGAFGREGRIALYGIYFDTGKAEVKPESRPTLESIAAMLNGQPPLALVVTGYTDNVGAFDANLSLSKRRADAVVAALVADFKVSPSRLTSFGAGQTGSRAPNATEVDRAKNRRVELSPR